MKDSQSCWSCSQSEAWGCWVSRLPCPSCFSLPRLCWVLSTHRGFQNQYLWNPTRICLLRKLKDKKATRASLLKCITQCRLSKKKKRAGLLLKAGFRVKTVLDYADSIIEKNAVLWCTETTTGYRLDETVAHASHWDLQEEHSLQFIHLRQMLIQFWIDIWQKYE